jgi:hypothetical protein
MSTSDPKGGQGAGASATAGGLTGMQVVLTVSLAVLVCGCVVTLTLVLAFHYATSKDTTSVLGVVIPIFSAIIGLVAGGSAGLATGSAGKKATQAALNTASAALKTKDDATRELAPRVRVLVEGTRENTGMLDSLRFVRAGTATAQSNATGAQHLDEILVNLGRLEAS